jgi:hypothetical protein
MRAPPDNRNAGLAPGVETDRQSSGQHSDSRSGPALQGPDIVIAIIEKDARTQVRVVLSSWRGKTKIHVRQFDPGPIAGQWWPSGKGAALDVERLPELVEALKEAESEARRIGLLPGDGRAA